MHKAQLCWEILDDLKIGRCAEEEPKIKEERECGVRSSASALIRLEWGALKIICVDVKRRKPMSLGKNDRAT
jgi:hypothetical protein